MPNYQFTVAVQRKELDLYEVEASSRQEATMKVGILMGAGSPPKSSRNMGLSILSVAQAVEDTGSGDVHVQRAEDDEHGKQDENGDDDDAGGGAHAPVGTQRTVAQNLLSGAPRFA